MIGTLKVFSLLLSYPTNEVRDALDECRRILDQENLIGPRERERLGELIDDLASGDLLDKQSRYVLLFDRTRSLSLNLFEHVHGESRDRGQAMVDLLRVYESHGLDINARELPDHIPMFLEFLSTLSMDEAQEFLGQPLHIIAALGERLHKRETIYSTVFDAILSFSTKRIDESVVREILGAPEDDPEDFDALDEIWEEEAVKFGPDAGAQECAASRLNTKLRAAMRAGPAPGNAGTRHEPRRST